MDTVKLLKDTLHVFFSHTMSFRRWWTINEFIPPHMLREKLPHSLWNGTKQPFCLGAMEKKRLSCLTDWTTDFSPCNCIGYSCVSQIQRKKLLIKTFSRDTASIFFKPLLCSSAYENQLVTEKQFVKGRSCIFSLLKSSGELESFHIDMYYFGWS